MDDIEAKDGELPMTCARCGAVFVWVLELEDLDPHCPSCRARATDDDDTSA